MNMRVERCIVLAVFVTALGGCSGTGATRPPSINEGASQQVDASRGGGNSSPSGVTSMSSLAPSDAGTSLDAAAHANSALDAAGAAGAASGLVPVAAVDAAATAVAEPLPGTEPGMIDPQMVVVATQMSEPAPAPACGTTQPWERIDLAYPTVARDERRLSVARDGRSQLFELRVSELSTDAGLDEPRDASRQDQVQDAGEGAASAVQSRAELLVVDDEVASVFTLAPDVDVKRGAALDPSGLTLVLVLEHGLGLSLWQRTAVGGPFLEATEQPFARVNALAQSGGVLLRNPVFSAAGVRLYAAVAGAMSSPIQFAKQGEQWDTDRRLDHDALRGDAVQVTAVSADELTLFAWDAATRQSFALWRDREDLPFGVKTVLDPAFVWATDQNCGRLWVSEP